MGWMGKVTGQVRNAAGIAWLTQEQTETIFSLIGGADEEARAQSCFGVPARQKQTL